MPRIKIVPNETLSLASSLDSKASQLSSISSSASSIVTGLSYNVRSKAGIQSKMGQARSLASNISGQIASLSGYVKTATNMFVEADKTNSIALSKVLNKYIKQYGVLPGIVSYINPGLFSSGVCKMIGEVGSVGAAVSVTAIAMSFKAYDKIFDLGIKNSKSVAKTIGTIPLAARSAIDIPKWFISRDQDFIKILGGTVKTSKAAKAAWVGADIFFTGIKNIILNIGEAKQTNMTGLRIGSEIVLETSIEVVTKLAIKSLIGVGLTAAIGSAAPAIVVGALAAGAYFALDYGYEKATGKSFSETISDGVLDFLGVGTTVTNKSGKANSPPIIEVSNKMLGFI